MYNFSNIGRNAQRTVCVLLSIAIVAAGLFLGAIGSQLPLYRAASTMTVQQS